MSNFDLVAFKNGRRAVTRDGRIAEFVGYEPRASEYQLVVFIKDTLLFYEADGSYVADDVTSDSDLVDMEPLVRYKSVTCYTDGGTLTMSQGSKEAAEAFQKMEESRSSVVKCVIFAYPQGE